MIMITFLFNPLNKSIKSYHQQSYIKYKLNNVQFYSHKIVHFLSFSFFKNKETLSYDRFHVLKSYLSMLTFSLYHIYHIKRWTHTRVHLLICSHTD